MDPSEDQARRELHARGLSDADIARELGVTTLSIFKWRRSHGLPPGSQRSPGEFQSQVLAMWHDGLTDAEMAYALKTEYNYVARGRRVLGLTPNRKCYECNKPTSSRGMCAGCQATSKEERRFRYFVAKTILGSLLSCNGDAYDEARSLALAEWPWLADSIERWEADGRLQRSQAAPTTKWKGFPDSTNTNEGEYQ